MISPAGLKLMQDAIDLTRNNPAATPSEKGYAAALDATLIMLTNRSNTQRYRLGHDSLASFISRQRRGVGR